MEKKKNDFIILWNNKMINKYDMLPWNFNYLRYQT